MRSLTRAQPLGGDVLDVGVPVADALDLARVDVECDHAMTFLGKGNRQRQADVAEAHDSYKHSRQFRRKAGRPTPRRAGRIAVVTASDQQPDPVHAALEERNALWAQALHARALGREVEAERTLLQLRLSSRSLRVTAPSPRPAARSAARALIPALAPNGERQVEGEALVHPGRALGPDRQPGERSYDVERPRRTPRRLGEDDRAFVVGDEAVDAVPAARTRAPGAGR